MNKSALSEGDMTHVRQKARTSDPAATLPGRDAHCDRARRQNSRTCPSYGRDYARRRSRQIAYGRWEPWADATQVREHVRQLTQAGASYRAIARAAGVSPMTICRLYRAEHPAGVPDHRRIRAAQARLLLGVTSAALEGVASRRDAAGTKRRLQALIALGHPGVSLARLLRVPPRTVWDLVRGTTMTVSPLLHTAVCDLYERLWDQLPPESTGAERRAATAARARAAALGWPTPMGLDEDQIDDPTYRPRTRWLPATGAGATQPTRRRALRRTTGSGAANRSGVKPASNRSGHEASLMTSGTRSSSPPGSAACSSTARCELGRLSPDSLGIGGGCTRCCDARRKGV